MKLRAPHIVLLCLSAIALYSATYCLLKNVNKDRVQIDCQVKAFGNADLQLFYSDDKPDFDADRSDKQPLIASQFYKKLGFRVPGIEEAKHLRLDFGEDKNTIVISKIDLLVRTTGRIDTVFSWQGEEIKQLIGTFNDASLQSSGPAFVVINAGDDDPWMLLNDSIKQKLDTYKLQHPDTGGGTVLSALLIAAIILIVLVFLFGKITLPPFPVAVHSGHVLSGGFFLVIFFVFLNNRFALIPDIKSRENRKLHLEPSLKENSMYEFPDLYTDYAKDNFSFRNSLFFLHSLYTAKVFGSSPLSRDVIIGKDGWFFNNEPGSISDYRRLGQLPQEELAAISISMIQKNAWLQSKGIKFYVIVPPNKEMVYGDKMPECFAPREGLGVNRLEFYGKHLGIHTNVVFINPTQALIDARKNRDVYYTTDTHWNLYGGYIAYQVLMERIKKDFPSIVPVQEKELTFSSFYNSEGDLAMLSGLQNVYQRKEVSIEFRDPSKQLSMPKLSSIRLDYKDNKTVDGSKLKLLMFRDSYANYLIPWLNLHFKDATYLWSYEFLDKVIEEEKPDVVIFESLQRFMPTAFMTPNPDSVLHFRN